MGPGGSEVGPRGFKVGPSVSEVDPGGLKWALGGLRWAPGGLRWALWGSEVGPWGYGWDGDPKKQRSEEVGKIALCGIIGHRPLWGRSPKTGDGWMDRRMYLY